MENEEKKVGCCSEGKSNCCESKGGCNHGMPGCCHAWKKCHMIRKIVWIILIIIAFCLGSQWGEMKGGYRGGRFERGGMMNWGGNRYNTQIIPTQSATDKVTVDVATPAVKQ